MERLSVRLAPPLLGVLLALVLLVAPLAAAATTVTSSAVHTIVIQPNDRPTIIDERADLRFVASAYAEDGSALTGLTFEWSTGGNVGRIGSDGMFTGNHGGIGTVSARNGAVTATVGVVVRAVATPTQVPVDDPEEVPETTTTVTNVNGNGNTVTSPEQETPVVAANTDDAADDATTCTTIRSWIWIAIALVYAFLLFVYYLSLGESMTKFWWLWPTTATAALLGLYLRIGCPSYQLWAPITIIVLGALLSLFYVRLLRPRQSMPPASIQ